MAIKAIKKQAALRAHFCKPLTVEHYPKTVCELILPGKFRQRAPRLIFMYVFYVFPKKNVIGQQLNKVLNDGPPSVIVQKVYKVISKNYYRFRASNGQWKIKQWRNFWFAEITLWYTSFTCFYITYFYILTTNTLLHVNILVNRGFSILLYCI